MLGARSLYALAVAGVGAAALLTLNAQVAIEPRAKPAPQMQTESSRANLRVDTTLVLVPVTVTDAENRPVTGLEKDNFRVLEDRVPQAITQFAMEDDPVALGFVFDVSGSMGRGLIQARSAAMEFFQNRDDKDEFFLVEFASSAKLVVPITQETGEISDKLLFSKSGGSTAFLDAVYLALNEMRKAKNTKRALVIISDGGDNHSRYSENEVRNVLREADVLIYSVYVGGDYEGQRLMERIAKETGGLMFPAGAAEFKDIATKIIVDLRNRYVLGYTPQNQQRDGKYRRIQVQLAPPRGLPPIKAHWRTGYYAPTD
jgi:Ca-activated chloride channel family protein